MPGATVGKKKARATVIESGSGVIEPERLYTFTELARLIGLTARKIRREVEEGRMDYVQISPERGRMIEGQQFLDWKDANRRTRAEA